MKKIDLKSLLIGFGIGAVVLVSAIGGALADRIFVVKPLDLISPRAETGLRVGGVDKRVVNEESVVIDVAEEVSPSVVTVAITTPRRRVLEFSPFGGLRSRIEGGEPQDIGTGFVVSEDGLIITNKHVVSDASASYKVVTKDGKEYEVKQVSRDPANDIAIVKIDASGLKPVTLGTSNDLKVGQFVVAIGTALGEFRHTVTTGVISGLGRGIIAGSAFEGYAERLDDVIQTDAAINPGNSGGPLLNSSGEVIGVNVAVAQGAQNIGFALPIDVVKRALDEYKTSGKFVSKPFLGVSYQMIDQDTAILNKVPQGAYVEDVIKGSSAASAGIVVGDIITKFDGVDVREDTGDLTEIISKKKVGDTVTIEIWRGGETITVTANLSEFSQ